MIQYQSKPVHTYVIPGAPIAWRRPGTVAKRFYDTQKSLKSNWAISLEYQKENQPFYEKTPLLLIAHFYFGIPESYSPARKAATVGQPYLYKADLDNLSKLILDACSSILFDDDCTIVELHARKSYDFDPRTEFALIPLGPSQLHKKGKS